MLPYFNRRNFIYFISIFLCLLFVLSLPSFLNIQSASDKQQTMAQNNLQSQQATVTSIFNNNLVVAGLSLIPYFGWGLLIATLYNTGSVVASYSNPFTTILCNPFVYIELAVYSYVVLKSIRLIHLFRQRTTRFTDLDGELVIRKTNGVYPEMAKTVAYLFILVTVVLLVSAFLEFMIIRGVL